MSYASSILAAGQSVLTAKHNAHEKRTKTPSVFELAIQNSEFSVPDAKILRTSPLRPVNIFYQKKINAGSGTTKSTNHTGTYGDSGMATLTYVTHVETIGLPRKMGANNVFSNQQIFNNAYEQAWKNLKVRHDASALAYAIANRCQLTAAAMNPQIASANPGTWDDTNFALEISAANKHLFIQKLKSAMDARYFPGELDVITDLQLMDQFRHYFNQGAGNDENTSYQFDGVTFTKTQGVIDTDYTNGATLVMPKGSLVGINWNEALNRTGVHQDKGGSVGELGTVPDPFGSGAVADISMYTTRTDTSANTSGGSPQDIVDQFELTLTIAYALPPLSVANDSVLMEIAQA